MNKNSVVVYKNSCALTGDTDGGKFSVTWCVSSATASGKKAVFASQKVRERDVILLSPESASNLENCLQFAEKTLSGENDVLSQVKETHELLTSDEETARAPVDFQELASLVRNSLLPDEVWGIYSALKNSLFFEEKTENSQDFIKSYFVPRSAVEIKKLEEKLFEKEHAAELRGQFLFRLKNGALNLPDDAKYMTEIEAFALGKSEKCRLLKDAGFKETVETAHSVLLKNKIWSVTRNPYPLRFGLSIKSAGESLPPPPEEERFEVPGIAFAIDNADSSDPDDAICFDGENLWVHIADPASSVLPDSKIDIAARNRGATLYLPEGAVRMLSESCLEDYALGLKDKSRALSFKIKLAQNGEIEKCDVLPTFVKVKRLTYEEAQEQKDSPELKPLFDIAKRNFERRLKNGAIPVTMPEVHIRVDSATKIVSIEKVRRFESCEVVREAMILAGEGAAKFAFANEIPFPFVSQESPDIPKDVPEGLAGQFRLRKCMRKRNVGVTPGFHGAMGVSMYSQVTSPLRRYGDLIAHQQLRAFIKNEPLIDKDEMLLRIAQGDAASRASRQAERNSNMHWTLVYLLQNPDWKGKAVCLSKEQRQDVFFIYDLGIEITLPVTGAALNGEIIVKPEKIDIPNLLVTFSVCG